MKQNIQILGVKIDCLNFFDVCQRIIDFLHSKKPHYITTVNPEFLLASVSDLEFKKVLNQADLSVADGSGLLWASTFLSLKRINITILASIYTIFQFIVSIFLFALIPSFGKKIIPERITGTDLVPQIAKICSENKKSIFFLGAGPGISKKTASILKDLYPKLIVAGSYGGTLGIWQEKYDEKLVKIINNTNPDCLLVAFGSPKQEKWISRNIRNLKTVKLAVGIGGAFDFITNQASVLGGDKASRAPDWLRKINLEWLHRLFSQPGRYRRILNAVIFFPAKILQSKLDNNK